MDLEPVASFLDRQAGVVSFSQLAGAGLRPHDVDRLLRRRVLVRVHPRVYLTHTGPPTWEQRAWAAVLWAAPSALAGESAVGIADPAARGTGAIHVVVAAHRRLSGVPGVRLHRTRYYDDRVLDLSPPRVRLEDALLDLAEAARTDLDAVAILADACGARRTTAARLLARAELRSRLARRGRLVDVLGDAAAGTCSALEQAYLDSVVRPHGLPLGDRQASHRHPGDPRYRDVLLLFLALCVELDGRLHHGAALARDADMERDLDAVALEDLLTLRLSWGQVVDRSCRTADRLGQVMRRRGWTGTPRLCPECVAAA